MSGIPIHVIWILFALSPIWSGASKPGLSFSADGRSLDVFFESDLAKGSVVEIHYFDHETHDETLSFQGLESERTLSFDATESIAFAILPSPDAQKEGEASPREAAHQQWRVMTSQASAPHQLALKNYGEEDTLVIVKRILFDGDVVEQREIHLEKDGEIAVLLDRASSPQKRSYFEVDAAQPVGLIVSAFPRL